MTSEASTVRGAPASLNQASIEHLVLCCSIARPCITGTFPPSDVISISIVLCKTSLFFPMLQRGDSDFIWYKQRVQQSRFIDPAAVMASTVSAPLNPEPADPKVRQEHSLPPKSFRDAVQSGRRQQTSPGDSQPHSPIKSYASSATAVDDKELLDDDKVVYEKHKTASGTEVLTSVKPSENYEESLKHNGEIAPIEKHENGQSKRQDKPLASGRKAGAGWQRSAYVIHVRPLCVGTS